jgi:hypothetical protein
VEHTQVKTVKHNQWHKNSRVYHPELFKAPKVTEQEATYYAALELVARIDEDLTRGIRHYRNKAGVLLTTLDEVVRAILDDDLLVPEEQESGVVWATPQELAA